MSTRESLSWAFVVANGIAEEPPIVNKSKIENEMKVNAAVGEQSWRSNGNDYQPKTHYRRPNRNNCKSYTGATPEHRHHQGNYNRSRRHQRGAEPQNWQPRAPRSNAKQQQQQEAADLEPKQGASFDNTSLSHKSMEEQKPDYRAARSSFAWDSPSMNSFPNNKPKGMGTNYKPVAAELNGQDPTADQEEGMPPLPRVRCQVTFSKDALDSIQWQPISQSQRVWEPLDVNQREALDPSHPMPSLPPGFEHVIPGKRALSIQTRLLLGENLEQAPGDDGQQVTIPAADFELCEKQHFIVDLDISKGHHVPQLKVTDGGTGDGYYVRRAVKWLPSLPNLSTAETREPPAAYWEPLFPNLEEPKGNDAMDVDDGMPQQYKSNGYFYNDKSNNGDQKYSANFGPTQSDN